MVSEITFTKGSLLQYEMRLKDPRTGAALNLTGVTIKVAPHVGPMSFTTSIVSAAEGIARLVSNGPAVAARTGKSYPCEITIIDTAGQPLVFPHFFFRCVQ